MNGRLSFFIQYLVRETEILRVAMSHAQMSRRWLPGARTQAGAFVRRCIRRMPRQWVSVSLRTCRHGECRWKLKISSVQQIGFFRSDKLNTIWLSSRKLSLWKAWFWLFGKRKIKYKPFTEKPVKTDSQCYNAEQTAFMGIYSIFFHGNAQI